MHTANVYRHSNNTHTRSKCSRARSSIRARTVTKCTHIHTHTHTHTYMYTHEHIHTCARARISTYATTMTSVYGGFSHSLVVARLLCLAALKVFLAPQNLGFWGGICKIIPSQTWLEGESLPARRSLGGTKNPLLGTCKANGSIFRSIFTHTTFKNANFPLLAPWALARYFAVLLAGDARQNKAFVSPFVWRYVRYQSIFVCFVSWWVSNDTKLHRSCPPRFSFPPLQYVASEGVGNRQNYHQADEVWEGEQKIFPFWHFSAFWGLLSKCGHFSGNVLPPQHWKKVSFSPLAPSALAIELYAF